jgi:hypothetical protein
MVILIFFIVAAIITLCIIFKKEDCLDAGGFCAAIILGLMIGGFAGLIGGCISSTITDNNLDYYSLESRSNYELIQQTVDDKTYYVKETTKNNIYYKFEYAISDNTKRITAKDDIIIEYDRAEKPRVTVEHYEPNIWLRLFTFCQAEDYYYITLPDHNYLSMSFD